MYKLLHAGVWRYLHSPLFWTVFSASVLCGAFCGRMITATFYIEEIYLILIPIILSVLVSLSLGREFSHGAIRNKIISGHRKGTVFISELILSMLAGAFLMLPFIFSFTLFSHSWLAKIPYGVTPKIFIGFLLLNIASAAIQLVISMLIKNQAVAAIVGILLILLTFFVTYEMFTDLSMPEYYYTFDYVIDEDGMITMERSEELVKNPGYIDGVRRRLYQLTVDVLPLGQGEQYADVLECYCKDNSEIQPLDVGQKRALNILPFYSLGLIAFISLIGWAVFRRHDMR